MSRLTTIFLLVVFAPIIWNFVGANEEVQGLQGPETQATTRRHMIAIVDCYVCSSCQQVTNNTTVKSCAFNSDILKIKKCVKYAEQYKKPVNGKNISWVVKGCVSEIGTCKEIRKGYVNNPDLEVAYCTECEGDKCNGGFRSLSDVFFSIFTVIFVPIFGKYVLS